MFVRGAGCAAEEFRGRFQRHAEAAGWQGLLGAGPGARLSFLPPAGRPVPTPTQQAIVPLPVLPSPRPRARLPARRAKRSEGTGRPVTPGLARAESRWPCGSVRSQGIPVLGFSIPWPEAAPQTKATEHGVAGQPPGACLPLPRP